MPRMLTVRRKIARALTSATLTVAGLTVLTVGIGAASSAPAGATSCAHARSGPWIGTWSSTENSGPNFSGSWFGDLIFTPTTSGDYSVSGSVSVLGSIITLGGPVTGSVTCGSVFFGTVSGSISFTAQLSSMGTSGSGTYVAPGGPDAGNVTGHYSTARAVASVSPPSGLPTQAVALSGYNFLPGETVDFTYTGTSSVLLCSAVAASDSTVSCSGAIPAAPAAGKWGGHPLIAQGTTTNFAAKTVFRLVHSYPVVTTTTLPNATVGSPYTTTLAATGGLPPYTWTFKAGHVPSGFSLSPSGVITATPTVAGTSKFTVQLTDAALQVVNVALSITAGP